MTNTFCIIMHFSSWHILAILLLILLKSSAQIDYKRTYRLQPMQDTYIHGDRTTNFQRDFLEVGRRGDSLESRILLKFNLDDFVQKSRWGAENTFADLIQSKITNVILILSCVSIGAYSVGQAEITFVGTVQVSQILQPWEQIAVTSSVRNSNGDTWWADSLDHTGQDASYSFSRSDVRIDYSSCQNGARISLNVSNAVFESWLDNPRSNHGLLIWTDLDPDSGVESTLKLASTESAYVDRHPQLVVSLQDTINDTGVVCLSQQFCCLDGSCINQSKICNFVDDCLHGNDEHECGIRCDFSTPCPWKIHPTPLSSPTPDGQNETHSNVTTPTYNKGTIIPLLVSPQYAESGPQCSLHISYSTYSSDIETLRVVLIFDNWNVTILEKTRSQQNQWLGDVLHLGQLRNPFHIVFEAELREGSTMGGSAIDSLEMKSCSPDLPAESCPATYFRCDNLACVHPDDVCNFHKDCLFGEDDSPNECGVIPYGGACSFEDGWCGWENVLHDDFNWTRHRGSTSSLNTGPSVDHTLGTNQGFYIYTETTRVKRGNEAYMRSVWFQSPPPETYDKTSPHYQTCKIRFFYHMYGDHIGTLKLYAYQNTTPETTNGLFTEYSEDIDMWQSVVAYLPAITESYYLQFESTRGSRHEGDMAVDDVMLSRQCFQLDDLAQATVAPTMPVGITETRRSKSTEPVSPLPTLVSPEAMTFHFSTCGGMGSEGPRQSQCNVAYRHENISVTVLDGIQSWVVPVTKTYSLEAMGAGGGTGVENTIPSRGAQVEASFHLAAGEYLLILVGQKGEDACHDMDGTDFGASGTCKAELTDVDRQRFGLEGKQAGGGGGGGGATFIAKWNETTGEYTPLLVAGGGGGLSFSAGPSSEGVHGSVVTPGSGFSGAQGSTYDVSGAGGGWNGTQRANRSQVSGMSFLQGGRGGVECPQAHTEADWRTHGGFGGGGGGCTSGGGGGGYTGGNAPLIKDLYGNGQGGTSYVHPSGLDVKTKSGANSGGGEVLIRAVIVCPAGMMIGENSRCIGISNQLPLAAIVGGIVPLIIVTCILVTVAVVYCRKKRTYHKASTDRRDTADYQLNLLRHNASTDFNPCYQLGDGSLTVKDLNELPRENLKLIRALGQGAFGEVYHGHFQPDEDKEPFEVAVKTLPARCTEQDESDFLMEALIMGNFEHANIVSLKGVCFTQSPRFILLEFMAGGEFKQFLRDSRPRRGQPSPLDMSDLLLAAYDVTKGCEYLESRRFIHRDIAARNILLSSKEKGRTAKIGDFGMARDIYRADYYRKGGQAMLPVKWMPPEAFLDGIFTSKTDVWSFGVLLWETMSLGYMPYPGLSNQEVIHFTTQGQRMNAPRNCPKPIQELMYHCWKQDPDERPSFSHIMEYIAGCLQNADIMNAPLPQDLLDEKNPSVMRPRNSKTSPVLKVHRSSAASAHTTSGAYATPGMGVFSPDDGDCDAYLTPDWILGGRMKDHLLLDNGNINNSAECLGAHGGTPNYESDRESVNKLKNKQKGRWMCPDSDTAFDPPINQDKNAYEVTNLLDKGELEVVAETSFIKPSPQNHLPQLDFSKLPKNPFQNSNPDKVQDFKTDDTSYKKSSANQNSRTPQTRKPNKPVQHSAHDSVPNGTLAADRDDACCSNRTEEQTPDLESQPNSPRGGDEQSLTSFSPRLLNRFRLPTFSRHSSFEVGAPQSQGPNTSPPNASLPMLNRMQSLPVSPNPYTMTALSSQPDLARSTPDTSSVVIGNGRSSSNVADRGGVIGAQSQAGREDGETNDAVV